MALPTVLVVDVDPEEQHALASALTALKCVVVTADSFHEGRMILARVHPTVLITPLRLREFNGIHLALQRQVHSPGTHVIIRGYDDPLLAREAQSAGAEYLVDPSVDRVIAAVRAALARVTRRWPRARVALDAEAGSAPARIVDVSYGGLRMVSREAGLRLNMPVPVTVGSLRLDAVPVWSHPTEDDGEACVYGAMLVGARDTEPAWHALVDAALAAGGA